MRRKEWRGRRSRAGGLAVRDASTDRRRAASDLVAMRAVNRRRARYLVVAVIASVTLAALAEGGTESSA